VKQLRKILVKVNRDGDWKWVHFCHVYDNLYEKFFEVTGCEKSEFTTFLASWAQGDFGLKLKMTYFEDIVKLREVVRKHYESSYEELYTLNQEENPDIKGWLRHWVSQHMRIEIAARVEDVPEWMTTE
jgi:hypothetical protein